MVELLSGGASQHLFCSVSFWPITSARVFARVALYTCPASTAGPSSSFLYIRRGTRLGVPSRVGNGMRGGDCSTRLSPYRTVTCEMRSVAARATSYTIIYAFNFQRAPNMGSGYTKRAIRVNPWRLLVGFAAGFPIG